MNTQIQKTAKSIRRRVLEHSIKNNGGYLSQACSSAEILAVLFEDLLNLSPVAAPLVPRAFPGTPSENNHHYFRGTDYLGEPGPDRDRFILSPTHYSLVLYAALIAAGRMAENGLDDFNKDGSVVEMIGAEHSPGMEVMTGSLGQGLAQAAGIALGRRLKKESGKVWVFMSDGEFQIGQTWETLQFLNHHELSNVQIIVDVNRQQCDGTVDSVMKLDPLADRLRAFGADVHVVNGHETNDLLAAGRVDSGRQAKVILAQTDACRNMDVMRQRAPKLHYLRFVSEEEKQQYSLVLQNDYSAE